MRQIPTILLSVVVTIAAIVIYDQIRGDGDDEIGQPSSDTARLDAFEDRLAAVEALQRKKPEPPGVDPWVAERLKELDRRLSGLPAPDEVPDDLASGTSPTPKSDGKPSAEDVEKFRKLAAAARREERNRKNGEYVDDVLARLQITLTGEQREQLVETYGAFESRRDEIWTEVKSSGSPARSREEWEAVISDTQTRIQREFTERISGFLSGGDAASIAEGLNGK